MEGLEWTVQNISFWNKDIHGEVISSPLSDRGLLKLYPRGLNGDEEYMDLRHGNSSVAFSIVEAHESRGELTYTQPLGSLARTRQTGENQPERFLGPEFDTIASNIKENELSRPDRLVLRLGRCTPNSQKLQSQIDVQDTSLEISADTFKNVPYRKIEPIWKITYNLEGGRRESVKVLASTLSYTLGVGTVQLFLEPEYHDRVFSFCCSVSFLPTDHPDEETLCRHVPSDGTTCFPRHVFRCKEMWEFGLLGVSKNTSGTFVIRLKFVSRYKCVSTDNSIPPKREVLEAPYSDLPSGTAFMRELKSVFGNKDFSDVQLRCNDVVFRAHKVVLSSRSPVLKYLLSSEAGLRPFLDIKDLDPPTLARLLIFLYSNTTEELNWDSALKLYQSAVLYQVPTLKYECFLHLRTNVSVANVCDVLWMADVYDDPYLTSAMHDFIVDHFNEVIRSEGWATLMLKNPVLVGKTVTHLGKRDRVRKNYAQRICYES